jgi:hypothetical protein
MALESASNIAELIPSNPPQTDQVAGGAGHLRMLKVVLQNTFPGMAGTFGRVITLSASTTATLNQNQCLFVNSNAAYTFSLPDAATLSDGYTYYLKARADTTVIPYGDQYLDGRSGARVVKAGTLMTIVRFSPVEWLASGLSPEDVADSINVDSEGFVAKARMAQTADTAENAASATSAATITMTGAVSPITIGAVALVKITQNVGAGFTLQAPVTFWHPTLENGAGTDTGRWNALADAMAVDGCVPAVKVAFA